ncbi:hypothetical protein F5Y15DRAFT_135795 [Xylariaceae sp. FL0016]|nr:hypothetical protein F5Y15DRAFT_135795 [Xylariaceae sp. FL0016]
MKLARLNLLAIALITGSSPFPFRPSTFVGRAVTELDQAAFEEAQQRDTTATRAFSNIQLRTSDGRCLYVDKLSGDFRANLTPVQVAECSSTSGQGWDIITSGKHNNVADSILVVSTLTNACFNFDPRRSNGSQVILFSCGGRADGGGDVADSQLFSFSGSSGPITFSPENSPQSCFTVNGNLVGAAPCETSSKNQTFSLGESIDSTGNATGAGGNVISSIQVNATSAPATATTRLTSITLSMNDGSSTVVTSSTTQSSLVTASVATTIPTSGLPVSRAGGILQPTAVAEAQQRDITATRAFTSVSIKASTGQCLFIDPAAGDFRQNLIPVSLVDCADTPNEKFDLITAGRHNNANNSALVVSSLTNGCISFDGRRPAGDTVTLFSCGGRADGGGLTNAGQLIPFTGGTSLLLAPESEKNATCIVPGDGRLDSAPCSNVETQRFTIVT